mgnify:CR=1 FL=1
MEIDPQIKKATIEYFRSNIYEALAAYSGWKTIVYARYYDVVGKEMADKYARIENYHVNFFIAIEYSFLLNFVILLMHAFDTDDRSYSLYKVEKEKTEAFILNNKEVLDNLFLLRNKFFAHREININNISKNEYTVPPVIKLDLFFENLIRFYNELSVVVDDSTTIFNNALEIKQDIERMFMNLYRGENIRKVDIDVKWLWEENDNKISKKI